MEKDHTLIASRIPTGLRGAAFALASLTLGAVLVIFLNAASGVFA
jgi:hypothetical protein